MSADPKLSPPVRFTTISSDTLIRVVDPKPEKLTEYRFSNGRKFQVPHNHNPYPEPEEP
jgi:hypothetical protein